MIIYNITTKVHHSIDADWRQWQQETFIPAMLATGYFSSAKWLRLLEQDDSEGHTYAVQFGGDDSDTYRLFLAAYGDSMSRMSTERWGDRVIAFRSLLEVIQ